jgi:hypothetical protein
MSFHVVSLPGLFPEHEGRGCSLARLRCTSGLRNYLRAGALTGVTDPLITVGYPRGFTLSLRTSFAYDRFRRSAAARVTPSAASEHVSELLGCPISRSLTACCVCLEPRPLPSTGITRLQRYCEPLRHPSAPGLSLTGVRLIIPDHASGLPVLRALSLCTCCRHYPGAADGRSPRSKSPLRISLPRFHFRVGLHIDLFEVCSAFTRVAACTLAQSPKS